MPCKYSMELKGNIINRTIGNDAVDYFLNDTAKISNKQDRKEKVWKYPKLNIWR